jgi:hypothetical protein
MEWQPLGRTQLIRLLVLVVLFRRLIDALAFGDVLLQLSIDFGRA